MFFGKKGEEGGAACRGICRQVKRAEILCQTDQHTNFLSPLTRNLRFRGNIEERVIYISDEEQTTTVIA